MSIPVCANSGNRPPRIPTEHNPLVCGIDYHDSCPSCRLAFRELRRAQAPFTRGLQLRDLWAWLARRHEALEAKHPPGPLPNETIRQLAWTCFDWRHRGLLRHVLWSVLRPV